MGTTAQEKVVTPDQQQQNPPAQQTESAETASQTTSTPEPQQPNKLVELMEANMREQAQRLREQDRLIETLRERKQQDELNPPIQGGQSAEEFWRDPMANIQKLLREETQRAVKPLYDFKSQMERQSGYDLLKTRFRNDPRYNEIFPKIEAHIDQLMNGADPSEQNMQLAVLTAIGAVVTGQIPNVQFTPASGNAPAPGNQNGQPPTATTTQGQGRVITPAHLRSSPVQLEQEKKTPQLRELTELESRLARERGQTKEEFLAWLDLPATEVAISKIGKPEKPDNPQSQVQRNVNPQGARA